MSSLVDFMGYGFRSASLCRECLKMQDHADGHSERRSFKKSRKYLFPVAHVTTRLISCAAVWRASGEFVQDRWASIITILVEFNSLH